ncbi:MAG: alpha/beta hydrolase [Chloroflexi bacterium]|nr:alpha/beta hydrolase [Chloroflexota bacterium]
METYTSQLFNINGRNLFVAFYGLPQNPVLIFLHHGLGSIYSWQPQIEVFANSGYCVIAYDRWGYGKSDYRSSLITNDFKEDLADLSALLDHLKIKRAALIGHSDGGTLAMYYAARFPEIIGCLVVVAAHIYVEPSMVSGILQVRKSFYENPWFRSALQHLHGDKTEQMFSNWYNGWVKMENLGWDMRQIIRSILCPTLVIQGENDEHATLQHARDIAEAISNSRLWLEPGARHQLPQDIPDVFNHKVLEFLKENYVS